MLIAIGATIWLLCGTINLNHAAPFSSEQTIGNGEVEGSGSLVMQTEHGQEARYRHDNSAPSNGPLRPSLALIYPLSMEDIPNRGKTEDISVSNYRDTSQQDLGSTVGKENVGPGRKNMVLHLINSPDHEKQHAIHMTGNMGIINRTPSRPSKLAADASDAVGDVSIFHNYYDGSLNGQYSRPNLNSDTKNPADTPHNLFQATTAPSQESVFTSTAPLKRTAVPTTVDPASGVTTTTSELPTTTTKRTMSNAMKAIGFSAIPTIGAAFMYGPQWIPALLALAGRRKKRSTQESDEFFSDSIQKMVSNVPLFEATGRSAQNAASSDANPWLALLSGQKYSSGTRQQLNDRLNEWRAPNANSTQFLTGRPQRFTVRPLTSASSSTRTTTSSASTPTTSATTSTTSRPSTSFVPESIPEQFTSRTTVDSSVQPTTNDFGSVFNTRPAGGNFVVENSNSKSTTKSSSNSFHVLPVSNSGDLDLVASFVQSTLSKFVDGSSDLENEVFVLNTPSVALNSSVTPASFPAAVGQPIGSALLIAANSGTATSPQTGESTLTTSSSRPVVTTDTVFAAAPVTAFPFLRQTFTSALTNSPIENYTVKPFIANPITRPIFSVSNSSTISNFSPLIPKDNPRTTTLESTTEEPWTRPYVLYTDPPVTRKPVSDEYYINPNEIPNTLPPKTTKTRPSSSRRPLPTTTPYSTDLTNPGQVNIYFLQRNSSGSFNPSQTVSTPRTTSSLITIQNFFSPLPIRTNLTTKYTTPAPQWIGTGSSYFAVPDPATIVSGVEFSTISTTTSAPRSTPPSTASPAPSTTTLRNIPTTRPTTRSLTSPRTTTSASTSMPVTGGAALGTLTGSSLVSDVLQANQQLSNIINTAGSTPIPPSSQQTRPATSLFPSSASLLTLKYTHSATTTDIPMTTTPIDLAENSTLYSSYYDLLNQISQGQTSENDIPSSTDLPKTSSKPITIDKSTTTDKPTATDKSTTTDKPTTTDKSTTTGKPTTVDKSTTIDKPITTYKPPSTSTPYSTTLSGSGLHLVNSATDTIDVPFDSFNTRPNFSFNLEPNTGGDSVEYLYIQNEDYSFENDVVTQPTNKKPTNLEEFVPQFEAVVAEEEEPSSSTSPEAAVMVGAATSTIAPQFIIPGLSAFNNQKKPDLNAIVVEANTQSTASDGGTFVGFLAEETPSPPSLSISPLANILNFQTNNPAQSPVASIYPFGASVSINAGSTSSSSSSSSAPSLYTTLSNAALPATGFAVAAVAYGAAALAPFWLPFLLGKKRRRNSQAYKKKNGYSAGSYDNDWAGSNQYNFANYYQNPNTDYEKEPVYYKLYDRRQRQMNRWKPRH